MSKFLNSADISVIEAENLQLDKYVTYFCSVNQEPVIVLKREVFTDPHSHKSSLIYRLYFRSHLDSRSVRVKHFHSLDAFCLWYVTKHPFRHFELINYLNIKSI